MENMCIMNTFMTKTWYPALKREANITLQKLFVRENKGDVD